MNTDGANQVPVPSTKPYLMRALYQWCVDFGFTPYVSVFVDNHVLVPMQYVKDNEIVLNVSPTACEGLVIDDESIRFKARFNGIPQDIWVPLGNVQAIYSRENSQGMSFPLQLAQESKDSEKPDLSQAKETTKSFIKLVK
jgi:stringent starvation protein B